MRRREVTMAAAPGVSLIPELHHTGKSLTGAVLQKIAPETGDIHELRQCVPDRRVRPDRKWGLR